jgi:hypothetical protein
MKTSTPKQRADSLKELQTIPGIGERLSVELLDLGYQHVADLKGEDPEAMYQSLMDLRGMHIDRCVLYVFRCAVYFASHTDHDPDLLQWWNWKDDNQDS